MVRCSVYGCKSDSERKLPGLSFHSFPTDEIIKERWIDATGRKNWRPKVSSRICSKHFDKNVLIKKKKVTLLLPNAIPCVANEPDTTATATAVNVLKSIDCNVIPSTSKGINVQMNVDYSTIASTSKGVQHSDKIVTTENLDVQINPQAKEVAKETSSDYKLKGLENKLNRAIKQSRERLKKLRALRERTRRLTKKVASLENVIAELKAKSFISEENGDLLESIDTSNKDFFKRFLCPSACGRKYSPSLRKFALCLHFISPRAYRYVREQFNTCLPHPSTLTKWYKSVDANPGFTTEALHCLKLIAKNKDKELFCAVSLDEMAIRKHVHWDGEKCVGLVNYGDALDSDCASLAREALVFMVTSINDSWKIPVGYFFIDGCNGEQKANLSKQCIDMLVECGINVISLTFDGCPSNFTMAKSLGCKFDSLGNITPIFDQNEHKTVIIPDPAHMLKLVRNTLGQKKQLTNACGEIISWKYFEELHILQENEGLHLANRLKRQHIQFSQQIMKVKLAAQTFSNSVADAIEFCNEQLQLQSFSGSNATVDFIRRINNLFDILNSRNIGAYGFKKPISLGNGQQILKYLSETEEYIKGLKLEGMNVLNTNRKVGFLGLLTCIQSLKIIYSDYILTGKLKFLPFYKLSQDHLEYFFSSIRSKGGFNNNPTAYQFQSAYKKLVVHGEVKSITSGNCIPLEEIKILTHTDVRYEKKLNAYTNVQHERTSDEFGSEDLNLEDSDHDYLPDPSRLSLYKQEIIPYIAGFVVRKLKKTIKCQDCLFALDCEEYQGIILKKDKGGLIYPSQDVVKICILAEKVFNIYFHDEKAFFTEKNLLFKLISSTFKNCESVFTKGHFEYQPLIGNHRSLLIKAILATYFEIRIHHATKQLEPKEKIRNIHTKLILFKGQ